MAGVRRIYMARAEHRKLIPELERDLHMDAPEEDDLARFSR